MFYFELIMKWRTIATIDVEPKILLKIKMAPMKKQILQN